MVITGRETWIKTDTYSIMIETSCCFDPSHDQKGSYVTTASIPYMYRCDPGGDIRLSLEDDEEIFQKESGDWESAMADHEAIVAQVVSGDLRFDFDHDLHPPEKLSEHYL